MHTPVKNKMEGGMERRSLKVNPVFAKRLSGKLKELGYWDPATNKPEVGRFCLENPYLPSYIYRWLKGEVPRAEALLTLAKRLDVEPDWLLGMEKKSVHPIAGGSGQRRPQVLGVTVDVVPTYQTWRRYLWCRRLGQPQVLLAA
jgi:hypothetical protein